MAVLMLIELLGRMHPLLVHLPIGFLIFGIFLIFYSKKENDFLPAVRLALVLGLLAAVASAVSGWLLYQSEGFAFETVRAHLIGGILTSSLTCWLLWKAHRKPSIDKEIKWLSTLLAIVLLATGHLGGNLTHGDDYLVEVLPEPIQSLLGYEPEPPKPISLDPENWEEALVYEDLVAPILEQNCVSCHSPKNKKGGLLLTSAADILAGGENGPVLTKENPLESPLIARMLLPLDHEDHMPPKEKRQAEKAHIELLKAWIETGADFSKTLGQARIKKELLQEFFKKESVPDFPITDLPPIPSDSLKRIAEKGILVETISMDNSLLKVSCINFADFSDSDWELMEGISSHIAWLDLSGTHVRDSILVKLANLPNLTVLKLNDTAIKGIFLDKLVANTNLKRLYLNQTQVDWNTLEAIKTHPSLVGLFAYNTPASKADTPDWAKKWGIKLETGGYRLPVVETEKVVY
jgi:uncharacterized membrane protein